MIKIFQTEEIAEVILLDPEIRLVRYVAKMRIKHNLSIGAVPTRYNKQKPLDAEINYYGGEIAFCYINNVYPDMSYKKFNPYDCMMEGFTIDVKTTDLENGRLIVKKGKRWEYKPDYFALMIGKMPKYRFAGFMKSTVLMVSERVKMLVTEVYAAEQSELTMNIVRNE
jgi:hypothetical protein